MPPAWQFWNSAKAAQIISNIEYSIAAGNAIASVDYWLMNDYGSLLGGVTTGTGYSLVAEVSIDGINWQRYGPAILRDNCIEVAITGIDNTGDAGMAAQTTSYAPLGSGLTIPLNAIPRGCGRKLSVRFTVPLGISEGTPFVRIVPEIVTGTLASASFTDVASANVAFSAANFTASTGNWTVDSGDQASLHYVRLGSLLILFFDISATDVSAATFGLRIKLPAALVVAAPTHGQIVYQDASGTWARGHYEAVTGNNFISLYKQDYGSNWTATSSDNTRVRGAAFIRV